VSLSERTLISRIGGLTRAARHDGVAMTEAARANGPGRLPYWENQVDPDGILDDAERIRRAEAARKAHYSAMALKSAQVRRKRNAS
jgi:hypothetical protein